MAGFLYFKPNHSQPRVTLENVRDWGLGYAFDKEPTCRECGLPASHYKGSAFAIESSLEGKAVGVYPAEQTWKKIPSSNCWVGYYNEHKPRAMDLARDDTLPSYVLPLGNGEQWSIPKVVHVSDGEIEKNLPCKLDVDDNGKIKRGEPIEKYQYLWELAQPYVDAFFVPKEDGEFSIDSSDILADAVKFLQVNYRIGLREAIMLELFPEDISKILLVCLCAIDFGTWTTWQESLKKTNDLAESAGLNSAAGKVDSTPAIAQPLQTS